MFRIFDNNSNRASCPVRQNAMRMGLSSSVVDCCLSVDDLADIKVGQQRHSCKTAVVKIKTELLLRMILDCSIG